MSELSHFLQRLKMGHEPYEPPLEQQHVSGRFGLWGAALGLGGGFLLGFAAGLIYIFWILTPAQREFFYIGLFWPFITGAMGAVAGLFVGTIVSLIVEALVLRREKRAARLSGAS